MNSRLRGTGRREGVRARRILTHVTAISSSLLVTTGRDMLSRKFLRTHGEWRSRGKGARVPVGEYQLYEEKFTDRYAPFHVTAAHRPTKGHPFP